MHINIMASCTVFCQMEGLYIYVNTYMFINTHCTAIYKDSVHCCSFPQTGGKKKCYWVVALIRMLWGSKIRRQFIVSVYIVIWVENELVVKRTMTTTLPVREFSRSVHILYKKLPYKRYSGYTFHLPSLINVYVCAKGIYSLSYTVLTQRVLCVCNTALVF